MAAGLPTSLSLERITGEAKEVPRGREGSAGGGGGGEKIPPLSAGADAPVIFVTAVVFDDTPPPVAAGPTDKKKLAKSYKTQMPAAEGIADMLSIKSKIGSTLKELTNPEHFIPNNKD